MKKIVIFLCLFFMCYYGVEASNKFKVTLDKCVDGDTARFIINGESRTVRFLSINTPEIAHGGQEAQAYGDEASKFTCDALSQAKSIKLQYDPKSDQVDKYDRVLAWVFVDGELLQEKLVREGLAEVKYVYDDYLYSDNLKYEEVNAKNSRLGMWAGDVISDGNMVMSRSELLMYCLAIIAIVLIAIFGNKNKKKYIKKIKKLSNIN